MHRDRHGYRELLRNRPAAGEPPANVRTAVMARGLLAPHLPPHQHAQVRLRKNSHALHPFCIDVSYHWSRWQRVQRLTAYLLVILLMLPLEIALRGHQWWTWRRAGRNRLP